MSTDWRQWHEHYDDPASGLARRLAVVRDEVRRLLSGRRGARTQVTSICAGDGRDLLPVLASMEVDVDAVLVEIDPVLADRARATVAASGLAQVEVRTGDAGLASALAGETPADVFLACGVFGNITDSDLETTIGALPGLVAPGGAVVWTRGASLRDGELSDHAGDPADLVRELFTRHGFAEDTFVRPADAAFRVGVHRRSSDAAYVALPERMFSFAR
ncbi:class I SAM-dependent methyltransferase [Nocardioides sp. NPDC006273]|uniref:class I SAM-dependent methyltransferase n=1 Tax=Nocardioides sp. NPDC006273 TaxID=3155598 RepID=UPI0033A7E1E5